MAYRFEQFAAARRQLGNIALSPDGGEVAYIVDTSGQYNLWRQSVAGGWPYQLTLFDDWAARGLAWSPSGEQLAVMADKDGAERYQIFLVPVGGGGGDPITDRMDVQYSISPGAFSPDGSMLAYSGNERKPTDNDVFLRDLSSGETRLLVEGMGFAFHANWSPDGRFVIVLDVRSNTDMDIYLVDVESGGRQKLTSNQEEAINLPGPWKRDGSGFYLMTDNGREFVGLAFCHLPSGEIEWVERPEWNVEGVDLSRDGRTLIWSVNENGVSTVHIRDLETGEERITSELPAGNLNDVALAPDGARAVVQMDTATRGMNLFHLDTHSGGVAQLTFGMLGGIPQDVFVEPELVHFPTFDGREVPAFLYKPRTVEGGQIPVVLSIHGGPESQERPEYRYAGLYQYLVYRGIAVLAPNIRGSTGYGKSYQKLIYHDWGGADLKDFEHAARYLLDQEWVDPDRIGVFGGSYGGFATLSCVTRLPEYWAAGAELVGPSNLVTFASSVPPTWRRMTDEWVGNPETERDFLLERSPITYVDQIRCPLLIMQGANDYRVVKAESDQMVERIRSRGGTVEYLVFPDEGHGFTRRGNLLKAYRTTAEFFLERFGLSNLLPTESEPEPEPTAARA